MRPSRALRAVRRDHLLVGVERGAIAVADRREPHRPARGRVTQVGVRDHALARRVRRVRQLCEQHEIQLGIHTLSAVNVAEFVPFLSDAVDAYIAAHVDLGKKLAACRMNPWRNAKAMYDYYQALAKCRDAIMPCDAAAKRRAGCV